MSIECLPFDPSRCSLADRGLSVHGLAGLSAGRPPERSNCKQPRRTAHSSSLAPGAQATAGAGTGPGTGRLSSQRRIDANRRNALRSTGPRTPAGKKRSSRNALKHGLCAAFAHLPGECGATFSIFVEELREQFQPRSIMQKTLFPQIADLIWRMNRMPEAQTKIFAEELDKARRPGDAPLASSDVLARRFSDDPNRNGFLLLGRYERGMQNQLLRLLRQYERETKQRPQTPYDPGEAPIPREGDEPAWTAEKAEAQRRFFESRQDQQPARGRAGSPDGSPVGAPDGAPVGSPVDSPDGSPVRAPVRAPVGGAVRAAEDQCIRRAPADGAERTQSKPPQSAAGASETAKSSAAHAPPVTERSHRDGRVTSIALLQDKADHHAPPAGASALP